MAFKKFMMKIKLNFIAVGIVITSIIVAIIINTILKGAYVSRTYNNNSTYWIGPVSTTLPYVVLAILTAFELCFKWRQYKSILAPLVGLTFGWAAMTTFTIWISSLETGPESSSTMGIAIGLTPIIYMLIFPIPYLVGRKVGSKLLRKNGNNRNGEI